MNTSVFNIKEGEGARRKHLRGRAGELRRGAAGRGALVRSLDRRRREVRHANAAANRT